MRTQAWVYVVVAVLSVGAAVAIAGVPRTIDSAPTIEPPASTTTTTTTTTLAPVADTQPSDEVTTTEVDDPDPSDAAASGDDEAAAPASTAPPSTTAAAALVARDALDLVVANGAGVGGAAADAAIDLEAAGYADVGTRDGSDPFDVTVVYASVGVEREAERLASDIGVDAGLIFPIDTSPEAETLDDAVRLMVYLGRDVRDLPFFN